MPKIVFTPSGHQADVASGTAVLDVARQLGVDIDSVCGGRGICGRCQITPGYGSFPKWGMTVTDGALSAPTETETNYRGKRPMTAGNRLSCSASVCADVIIDVPASSQVHRQVVRKAVDLTGVVVDPVVTLHYLQLGPNDEGISATHLVRQGLLAQHNVVDAAVDHRLFATIVSVLNKEKGHVTVAVEGARTASPLVTGIWVGFVDAIYGIAVDIGSTTIAGHLCDLSTGEVVAIFGRMKPQIRFGEDLLSRVSYVMMNPGGEK